MPTQDRDDRERRDAEILDRLIRDARVGDEPGDVSADELGDYLEGRLTQEQVEVLQARLAGSKALREQLGDLAALSDPAVQARFDAAPAPRRRGPVLPRWGFLAAAVLAAAVLVVWSLAPPASRWTVMHPLTRDQVLVDPLRGVESRPGRQAANADAAARMAFQDAVRFDGASFTVITPDAGPLGSRPLRIALNGAAPVYAVRIPEGAENVTVWFLSIPTLERRSLELAEDNARFDWPDAGVERGAVTVAYRVNGRHFAAPAGEVVKGR